MAKQTLSIEQMQHLKKLGININDDTPAFVLEDILELLPVCISVTTIYMETLKFELHIKRMVFDSRKVKYVVVYEEQYSPTWYGSQSEDNLIDAAYGMLLWCIKYGYLENQLITKYETRLCKSFFS